MSERDYFTDDLVQLATENGPITRRSLAERIADRIYAPMGSLCPLCGHKTQREEVFDGPNKGAVSHFCPHCPWVAVLRPDGTMVRSRTPYKEETEANVRPVPKAPTSLHIVAPSCLLGVIDSLILRVSKPTAETLRRGGGSKTDITGSLTFAQLAKSDHGEGYIRHIHPFDIRLRDCKLYGVELLDFPDDPTPEEVVGKNYNFICRAISGPGGHRIYGDVPARHLVCKDCKQEDRCDEEQNRPDCWEEP